MLERKQQAGELYYKQIRSHTPGKKKLWKREASQWRLWTPLRTNINFFFRGISTTKVDWKIMDPTFSNQKMVKLQLSGTWKSPRWRWNSICFGNEAPILTMAQEGTTRILDANYDITDLEKKVNPCDLSYKKGRHAQGLTVYIDNIPSRRTRTSKKSTRTNATRLTTSTKHGNKTKM